MGRRLLKPRPPQGQRLRSFRLAAGLTQAELARAIGVPQANVAFWERSAKPPRSDVLAKMARVLRVTVEDLLGVAAGAPIADNPGPVGEVQRAFEEVRSLPRRQQRKVLEFVFAFVNEYRRKAS